MISSFWSGEYYVSTFILGSNWFEVFWHPTRKENQMSITNLSYLYQILTGKTYSSYICIYHHLRYHSWAHTYMHGSLQQFDTNYNAIVQRTWCWAIHFNIRHVIQFCNTHVKTLLTSVTIWIHEWCDVNAPSCLLYIYWVIWWVQIYVSNFIATDLEAHQVICKLVRV